MEFNLIAAAPEAIEQFQHRRIAIRGLPQLKQVGGPELRSEGSQAPVRSSSRFVRGRPHFAGHGVHECGVRGEQVVINQLGRLVRNVPVGHHSVVRLIVRPSKLFATMQYRAVLEAHTE